MRSLNPFSTVAISPVPVQLPTRQHQSLCQSLKTNIAELIEEYLIKDWQAQGEPEHLRTIRDRHKSKSLDGKVMLLQ